MTTGEPGPPRRPRPMAEQTHRRTHRLALSACCLPRSPSIAVGIAAVAAYVFVSSPSRPRATRTLRWRCQAVARRRRSRPVPRILGPYCHISARTDDPTPLTTAELFPPAFTNEADKSSYSLVSTKLGQDLLGRGNRRGPDQGLKAGNCTQVLRASYVSGDGKIMGTIGVVNLTTTNEAHEAGRVVGQNDFIAPLTAAKGVASKLGNGTGVVEAEYKGHYLILTWSEFVNGATPSTKAQDSQLEQFSNDLVAGHRQYRPQPAHGHRHRSHSGRVYPRRVRVRIRVGQGVGHQVVLTDPTGPRGTS